MGGPFRLWDELGCEFIPLSRPVFTEVPHRISVGAISFIDGPSDPLRSRQIFTFSGLPNFGTGLHFKLSSAASQP